MNAPIKNRPAAGKPINICGIVVHLAPHKSDVALEALAALPGVEIIGHSAEGRVAITAVDTPETLAIDQLTAMHRLPGVVAASLAYHAFEGETPAPAAPFIA
jgi:periplasmic nitrate reductase NapD